MWYRSILLAKLYLSTDYPYYRQLASILNRTKLLEVAVDSQLVDRSGVSYFAPIELFHADDAVESLYHGVVLEVVFRHVSSGSDSFDYRESASLPFKPLTIMNDSPPNAICMQGLRICEAKAYETELEELSHM